MVTLYDNAFQLMHKHHQGQLRKGSDTPYIVHPITVANILMASTTDEELIAAGLCHDLLEDTNCTFDELKLITTLRVAEIVREVTRDEEGKSNIETKEGVMLKCADMIHNMSDCADRRYIAKKVKLCRNL